MIGRQGHAISTCSYAASTGVGAVTAICELSRTKVAIAAMLARAACPSWLRKKLRLYIWVTPLGRLADCCCAVFSKRCAKPEKREKCVVFERCAK